jgi:hypothetical protein
VLAERTLRRAASDEPRRELSPRVAARDPWKRLEALSRMLSFMREYREAWRSWRAGVRDVLFPAGTYLLRVQHGARCAAA